MTEIQIFVDLTPLQRDKLQAIADVTLRFGCGELTIRGCRVYCTPGKSPWVSFPSIPYEKEGQTRYRDVLEFSRAFKKRLTDAILEEHGKAQS